MEDGEKKVWMFPNTFFYAWFMAPLVLTIILLIIAWQKPSYVGILFGVFVPFLLLPLLPKAKWSELRKLDDTEVFMPYSKFLALKFPVYDYIGPSEGYFLIPFASNGKVIINERIHEKLSPKALAWLIDQSIARNNSMRSKTLILAWLAAIIVIVIIALNGLFLDKVPWSITLIVFVLSWFLGVGFLAVKLNNKNLKNFYDPSEKETALEALDYIDRTMNELHPPAPGKSKQLHTAKMRKIIADAELKALT